MSLAPGVRLGPYEIVSPLGAGGMGEVYRALDPRLRREVALKILPPAVAQDPERLKRFEREARAVAGLSHPNLVVVHDVGVGDPPYIVMELVAGETLRERLRAGPLAPAKAAKIAAQIARALAAAHARGIVHRDLKPENVVLDRHDHAKVLDFGLARLATTSAISEEAQAAPTLSQATEAGAVMGTPGYIAPEQVRGEPVDPTADVFALGLILYEMLTAERAFAGQSAVETLHAILRSEPQWDRLPEAAAPLLPILRRCLEKLPEARFQSAADLAWELERPAPDAMPARSGHSLLPLAGALLVGALLTGIVLRGTGKSPDRQASGAPAWANAKLRPITTDPGYEGDPSFSPDGETIAYASDRGGDLEIYLQQLSGGPALNLTHDPADDTQPAFSPDGKQIAFVSGRGRAGGLRFQGPAQPLMGGGVWTMPALGGAPRRVVEAGNMPSWAPDGRSLVYMRGIWFKSEIARVPIEGGAAQAIAIELPADALRSPWLLWPSLSPDGEWLAFEASERIHVVPSRGGAARVLGAGRRPVWSPDGRSLIFTSLEPGRGFGLVEAAFPAPPGASAALRQLTFGPGFATAASLARDGRRIAFASQRRVQNLASMPFDAEGAGVVGPEREITRGDNDIRFFHPSPDGREVAVEMDRGGEIHVWKIAADSTPVQLTSDPAHRDAWPRWSPDGSTIAFMRRREIWLMASDGGQLRRSPVGNEPQAEPAEGSDTALTGLRGRLEWTSDSRGFLHLVDGDFQLLSLDGTKRSLSRGARASQFFDATADARWIAYQNIEGGSVDIHLLDTATGAARPLVTEPSEDYHPFFSPAGTWLYFQPDHKNVARVPGPAQGWRPAPPEPVTRFPEVGLYLEEPQVSRDGKTLFFIRGTTVADLWLLELGADDAGGGRR